MEFLSWLLVLSVFFMPTFGYNCDKEPKHAEARLKKDLFCGDYDKSVSPTQKPLVVKIGAFILNLYDFDSGKNKMTINVLIIMDWADERLKWDRSKYDNISLILVPYEDTWSADLEHYSSYDSTIRLSQCENTKNYLLSSGKIINAPICDMSAVCSADYTKWPYDTLSCEFGMGAFPESDNDIVFNISPKILTNTSRRMKNSEWEFLTANKSAETTVTSGKNYTMLLFTYKFQRHSGEHSVMFVSPAFVMFALNTVISWFAIDALERHFALGINILSHIIMLEMVYYVVPFNGETVPFIIIYYRNSLITTAALLIFTILAKYVSYLNTKPQPWIEAVTSKVISNKIGELCFTLKYYDLKKLDKNEAEPTDIDGLIEKLSPENKIWRQFVKITDRIVCFITIAIYSSIILSFL